MTRFAQRLFLAGVILGCLVPAGGAEFTAKWVGATNGPWNSATNWDIGRVPNNDGGDTYDVVWDQKPFVILLETPVVVRHFTFATPGTLTSSNAAIDLTITGNLEWSRGTMAGPGLTSVGGQAQLRASIGNRLLLDGRQLRLSGIATLTSPLRFVHQAGAAARLHVAAGAQLLIGVSAGFEVAPASNLDEIENDGWIQFYSTSALNCQAQILNRATCNVGYRTLNFSAGVGIRQLAGTLTLGGTTIPRGPVAPGGTPGGWIEVLGGDLVATDARAGIVTVGGASPGPVASLSGTLTCDQLELRPAGQLHLHVRSADSNDFVNDFINVREQLSLSGRLEVSLSAPALAASNVVEIVRLENGATLQGTFANVGFGQVFTTTNGSCRLETLGLPPSAIVLTGFHHPLSVNVPTSPLGYPLVPADPILHMLPVASSATVDEPSAPWDRGSLDLVLTGPGGIGFLKTSVMAFSSDQLLYDFPGGPLTPVASVAGGPSGYHFDFNEFATTAVVQDLLRAVGYADFNFNYDFFVTGAERHPDVSVEFRVRDGDGNEFQTARTVTFPYQVGFRCEPSHFVEALQQRLIPLESQIISQYSDGQEYPNYDFQVTASSSCTAANLGVSVGSGLGFLGTKVVQLYPHALGVCSVEVRSAAFGVRICIETISPSQNAASGSYCTVLAVAKVSECEPAVLTPLAPAGFAAANAGAAPVSLATFHALENWMQQSSEGRRLAQLYWTHTHELVLLLTTHGELTDPVIEVLSRFQPGVVALLAGRGSDFTISQELIDKLNQLWDRVVSLASPSFRLALLTERSRFHGFQDFVGQHFDQWATLLQMPPPPTAPWIYLSSPQWSGGRFSVEVNRAPDTAMYLWHSADLKHWEIVPGAQVQVEGETVLFTDPTPATQQPFYRVSAAAP